MTRKLSPQALTAAFLTLSAALSIAILAVRNLFDDEIFSLYLVTGHLRDILAITSQGDVHPPGMYLLTHLAWRILPSYRWMNLAPLLVLYIGLAVFLLQVAPLFTPTRSQLCLLLLATLHPQLLLWSTTFRWYSWWTGLALITLTVALHPRKPHPTFTTRRALTLGLLLAALFYLNYITFLFAVALAVAISLRYRTQPPKALFTRALLAAAVFLALIAPQLHTMLTVHIPNSRAQHSSIIVSTLRLLQSIATSEAYLPWHPIALLAVFLFACLCIIGLIRLPALLRAQLQPCHKTPPSQGALAPEVNSHTATAFESPLPSITLFAAFFFLLIAATGLGGRPRNALLLIPTLAPLVALILETLRPRLQAAALLFFALWSAVGTAHLLGRYGLTKSSMNDHPEQVAAFIEQKNTCNVVVTYDSLLAYTLADLPRTLIISPYRGPGFDGALALPADCPHTNLYAVNSYLNGSARRVQTYNGELETAEQYIQGRPATNTFSPDSEAPRKRRLAALGLDTESADPLPDNRYVITSGPIDPTQVDNMRHHMPHFVSGYPTDPNPNTSD